MFQVPTKEDVGKEVVVSLWDDLGEDQWLDWKVTGTVELRKYIEWDGHGGLAMVEAVVISFSNGKVLRFHS